MIDAAGADNRADRADRPGSAGEHHLQQQFGTTDRADRFYDQQVCHRLLPAMVEFVQRMTMAFVATADAHGECDSTLRAGPPGFVQVLDERHVAWPEYRGNGVMASLGNIAENPNVGLLLVDFADDLIGLHVNGAARIVDDTLLRAQHPGLPEEQVPGRRTDVWVVVEVEEAYVHCRKHIPRMQLVERQRPWGSDDTRRKGGDYFGAAAARRADTPDRGRRDQASRSRGWIHDPREEPARRASRNRGHRVELPADRAMRTYLEAVTEVSKHPDAVDSFVAYRLPRWIAAAEKKFTE